MSGCPELLGSLRDLETRLSAAVGSDRGLADEVLRACGHKGVVPGPTPYATLHWENAHGLTCPVLKRENPLERLSDARSLIDRSWEWQTIKTGALKYTSGKQLKFECREPSEFGWAQGTPVFRGDHDLETFAICLAAVRARIFVAQAATNQATPPLDTTQASAVATGISPPKS